MTSHDVVGVARRALGTQRIGHTGTLDPFATGLLVLLVGKTTRLLPYVEGEPKVYEATIQFGAETTTDDSTGDVVREAPLPEADAIDAAIRTLTGDILQRPPDYSAKKVGGRRAFVAARAGRPLSLAPGAVRVFVWIVRQRDERSADVVITCSGGTYVRALARDLGRFAASAAHLSSLRRTRNGVFDLAAAQSLDAVRAGNARLECVRAAIPHVATQAVSDLELRHVLHGRAIDARVDAPFVALVDAADEMIALAVREGATFQPRVVLRDE